jgi:hypothetical protein
MDSSGGWEEGPLDMRKYEIWQRWMSGHVVEICQVKERSSHSTTRANYDIIYYYYNTITSILHMYKGSVRLSF